MVQKDMLQTKTVLNQRDFEGAHEMIFKIRNRYVNTQDYTRMRDSSKERRRKRTKPRGEQHQTKPLFVLGIKRQPSRLFSPLFGIKRSRPPTNALISFIFSFFPGVSNETPMLSIT
jgi:hypothetical protein